MSDFVRCLRRLNPDIDCWVSPQNPQGGRPATIYYKGEPYFSLPKGIIPEQTIKTKTEIVARGWRDLVNKCAGKGWVKKEKLLKLIDRVQNGLII
jgi:hypothetical protein